MAIDLAGGGQAVPARRPAVSPTLGLLPVIAVSTAAAIAMPARAEDTATTALPTIVVDELSTGEQAESSYTLTDSTSRKVATKAAETPKSSTVITQREIQERGATSLYDVLRTTPGITLQAGEGGTPAGDIPQIRGMDASNDILIDGIRNSSRTSYESFALESVEIDKGPSGATDGAGTGAGTINLTTKTPLPGKFDDVQLTYGTGNFRRATLDSNRDFGAIGARLNLMYQGADDLGGKKGKTSKRYGVAPTLSWKLNDSTTMTGGVYYYRNQDMPDYGVRLSTAAVPSEYRSGSGTSASPYKPIKVPTDTYYGTPGRDFTNNTSWNIYDRLDHTFDNGLKWSTTLRYGYDSTRVLVTQPGIDGDAISRGTKSTNRTNKTTALNSQLSGEGEVLGLRNRYGVGVDISRNVARQYTGFSGSTAAGDVSYTDPDLGHWHGDVTSGGNALSKRSTTLSQSLYAFDAIDIAPRFTLSLGASYDHYDVSTRTISGNTLSSLSSDLFNGSAGLVYHLTANGMIYGTVATASTPGGLGAGTGGEDASDDLDDLDPERSISYELGTKWQLFDQQLLLSADVFRVEKNNARVENEDGEEENIGKTRSQGVELGFSGQITRKWGMSAGYVYQHVELVDGGYTTPRGGGTPYPAAGNGKQLVKIPKQSFSLWSTYQATDKWMLGGGATYIGQRVAAYNTSGQAVYVVPDSWQVDLMTAYNVTPTLKLQLNVNNIFDAHVYGDAHSSQHVYVEPGRNYTISLLKRF